MEPVNEQQAAELENSNEPAPAAEEEMHIPIPPAEMAAGLMMGALDQIEALADDSPQKLLRELALVKTKVEEALLWLGRFQQLEAQIEQQKAANRGKGQIIVPESPGLVVVGDDGRNEQVANGTGGE